MAQGCPLARNSHKKFEKAVSSGTRILFRITYARKRRQPYDNSVGLSRRNAPRSIIIRLTVATPAAFPLRFCSADGDEIAFYAIVTQRVAMSVPHSRIHPNQCTRDPHAPTTALF